MSMISTVKIMLLGELNMQKLTLHCQSMYVHVEKGDERQT
jgi:hypothetical protein